MNRPILACVYAGIILLGGCATPDEPPSAQDRLALLVQNNAPLSLHDRFVRVALTDRAGRPLDRLYRWPDPLRIQYLGPDRFKSSVEDHAVLLGATTGLPVHWGMDNANLIVRIADPGELRDYADRITPQPYGYDAVIFICSSTHADGSTPIHPRIIVDIADDLPPHSIEKCIVHEMTQALGLTGDLDGRLDSSFSRGGIVRELTDYDRQVIAILFDDRLQPLMPRAQVLAVLPEIVADVEARN